MSSSPTVEYDLLLDSPFSYFPAVQFDPSLTKTPPKHLETAVWGIGIAHAAATPSFTFNAWVKPTAGDYYAIRIEDMDNPAAKDVISDATSDFYYLKVNTWPQGEVPMFGRVVRAGSLNESRSITKTILIKLTNPGGYDREVTRPWHSGLTMSIENLPRGAVLNNANTAKGMVCLIDKYLACRKNDVITVKYDGIPVEHVVSPEEAEGPGPIRVLISREVIDKGRKSGTIEVVFTVKDVVGNIPAGEWVHSRRYKLQTELDSSFLKTPYFLVDDNETSTIDLRVNQTSIFEVQVSPPKASPAPSLRNQITVVVTFTPASVRPKVQTLRLPAIIDRNRERESIFIDYQFFASLGQGSFRVQFEWHSAAGVLLGTSASTDSIDVFGMPVSMPAVTVLGAQAGLIAPNTDITVQIPTYQPHNAFLLETMVFQTADGVRHYERRQPAGVQGGDVFVSKDILKKLDGKGPFDIYYTTDDDEETSASVLESVRLQVEVGYRVAMLEAPLVEGAKGNNINPADVKGSEVQLSFPYSETIKGDTLYWDVVGKDARGSLSGTVPITKSYAGIALPSVFFPVDRTKVLDNNIDLSISVSYSVVRPGKPQQVFRSKVLDLTVGVPVELGLSSILEADKAQQTIEPKKVINGATLRAAYKTMRAGDKIAYSWQGQYGISQYEGVVSGTPNADHVDIPIPVEVIARGLRQDGNNITVACKVIRGQFVYAFPTLDLRLLPLAVLPTPRIRGFENTTVLPVSLLAKQPRIDVGVWDFIRENQLVWLKCTGTFAEDERPYVEDLYVANKVIAEDLIKGLSLPLPIDKLRQLKDGSTFQIDCWVSFPGMANKDTATQFGVANYIIQQLPAVLPYPTLNGATSIEQETTADPLAIQDNTRATVKYPGMLATDSITLSWIFQDGTSYSLTLKGLASGTVVFDLTAAQVLHNSVNSRVQLKYSMVRGGKATPSNVQTITVGTIAPAKLPRALLNGRASGSTLVLTSFTGHAIATVAIWTLIKAGQLVWLSLFAGGRELKVLDGYSITPAEAAQGLSGKAAGRFFIAALPTGSAVDVRFWVAYDGTNNRQAAVEFPVTKYTVDSRVPPPVITTVIVASSGRGVPNGGAVSAAEGRAINIYGTCYPQPFVRGMRVGPYAGGGYEFYIPANATSWQTWSSYGNWPSPQDHYAIDLGPGATIYSAPFRVVRT